MASAFAPGRRAPSALCLRLVRSAGGRSACGPEKQRYDMNAMKRTTRKAVAKAKEAIAEVLGDGDLREEAKADQRNAEEDNPKGYAVKPMGNLDQLT